MFISPDRKGFDEGMKLLRSLNHPSKTEETADIAHKIYIKAADSLKQKVDEHATTEFISLEGMRIVLSVLPGACSRHNNASRSWGVTSAVKAAGLSGTNSVIFLLSGNDDHAYAQAVAAARPFSPYSSKSKVSEARQVDLVMHLHGSPEDSSKLLTEVTNTVEGLRLCQTLVDAPPNELHTDAYVEKCREVATSIGCGITVIQGDTKC